MIKKTLKWIKISMILIVAITFVAASGFSFHQAFVSRAYNAQVFTHQVVKEKVLVKGNKEVILLGMIHLGEDYFYANIKQDYASGKYLALTEGVQDKSQKFNVRMEYSSVGDLVGLKAQPRDLFSRSQSADLDFKDLDPVFVAKMEAFFEVINDMENISEKRVEDIPYITGEELEQEAILNRNKNLKKVLVQTLEHEDYIVVPWGAAHLLEMEDFLLDRGFHIKEVRHRPAINVVGAFSHFLYHHTSSWYLLKSL